MNAERWMRWATRALLAASLLLASAAAALWLSQRPWFDVRRDVLDETLPPIVVPTTATTGAGH